MNIWENRNSCAEQYICATELYLMSMFSYAYNIIIYCGARAPGNGREVVDGLKTTEKSFSKC